MIPRWIRSSEEKPPKNGKYWVYPYISVNEHIMVAMASFTDGEWVESYRPQEYTYWQHINVPDPPKYMRKTIKMRKNDNNV